MNRTPVTGEIEPRATSATSTSSAAGLHHTIAQAPKEAQFDIWLNIITPYMPITSDGKAPNLKPFLEQIANAVGKAVQEGAPPDAAEAAVAEGRRARKSRCRHRRGQRRRRIPVQPAPVALRAAPDRQRRDRRRHCRSATSRPSSPTTRPSTARSPACTASRAARSITRTGARHHARHADGRGVRAPGLDVQQGGLHREGGLQRGAQGCALGRAPRLHAHVVEGLLDPRGPRSGRQARRARRAGDDLLRARCRRLRHDDPPDFPGSDEGARRPQDRDRQSRPGAVGGDRDGP